MHIYLYIYIDRGSYELNILLRYRMKLLTTGGDDDEVLKNAWDTKCEKIFITPLFLNIKS